LVVIFGFSTLAIDTGISESQQATDQAVADAVTTATAAAWGKTNPTGAPTEATMAGAATTGLNIAILDGLPVSVNNSCGSGGDYIYYDVATTGGACSPPAGWKSEVEIRIPPTGTLPPSCVAKSYLCVQATASQISTSFFSGSLNSHSATVSASSTAYTPPASGGGSNAWSTNTSANQTGGASQFGLMSSPNPQNPTSPTNELDSVSCVSSTFCMAVGYFNNTQNQTLIEQWNGSTWSVDPSPDAPVGTLWTSELNSVSCTSVSFCMAVGYGNNATNDQTLIGQWDGTYWNLVTSPSVASKNNYLQGVSCFNANFCQAVGYYYTGTYDSVLIDAWGGASWTQTSTHTVTYNTSLTKNNFLRGVSCPSATFCMAAGYAMGGSLVNVSLTEADNSGTWGIVASANVAGDNNHLYGISCTGSTFCMAAGAYVASSNAYTLIDAYNSGTWTVSLQGAIASQDLYAVSCYGTNTFCMAAGIATITTTMIEQWNGTTWSSDTSPNEGGGATGSQLYGVSCPSATVCNAAGWYTSASPTQTLISQWTSGTWSLVTSANNANMYIDSLQAVSCASASFCMAAGYVGGSGGSLIEEWNGISWSIVASPNRGTNVELSGISCFSTTLCMAVGLDFSGSFYETLIEEWAPTSGGACPCTWTIDTSYTPASQSNLTYLYGVSCPTASFCMAVGYYTPASVTQNMAEEWTGGTTWTNAAPLDQIGSTVNNTLYGVSCVSSTWCKADGRYCENAACGGGAGASVQTLIEQWTSGVWTIDTSQNTSASVNQYLSTAISCADTNDCMVGGRYQVGAYNQTLIEQYTSGTWAIVASPNEGSGLDNHISGISCSSATTCIAVGYYDNGQPFCNNIAYTGYCQAFAEQYSAGAWSLITTANQGSSYTDELLGVSCTSATVCISAGYYNDVNDWRTFVEQLTGTPVSSQLTGVSCFGTTFCMAVGYYNNGTVNQTLIEEYSSGAWSVVASPNAGSGLNNYLEGVSCTASNFCVAVGYYYTGTYDQTVIETWGSSWALTSSDTTTYNNSLSLSDFLRSVSCVGTTYCMAVGDFTSIYESTTAETFDGTNWTHSTPLNYVGNNTYLYGVSCTASNFCMAVGDASHSASVIFAYAEEWTTSWTALTPAQHNPTNKNYLYAVSCTGTTNFCMAAGDAYDTGATQYVTFTQQWDGSTWTEAGSEHAYGSETYLRGISCIGTTFCMAVGDDLGANEQTLAWEYNSGTWSQAATINAGSSQDNFLYGDSCTSVNFCMAGGYYAAVPNQTLIEEWSGGGGGSSVPIIES
jgi:hypothetical protein